MLIKVANAFIKSKFGSSVLKIIEQEICSQNADAVCVAGCHKAGSKFFIPQNKRLTGKNKICENQLQRATLQNQKATKRPPAEKNPLKHQPNKFHPSLFTFSCLQKLQVLYLYFSHTEVNNHSCIYFLMLSLVNHSLDIF